MANFNTVLSLTDNFSLTNNIKALRKLVAEKTLINIRKTKVSSIIKLHREIIRKMEE